jgi:hypothetical protein
MGVLELLFDRGLDLVAVKSILGDIWRQVFHDHLDRSQSLQTGLFEDICSRVNLGARPQRHNQN